jgi:hypothetical protein
MEIPGARQVAVLAGPPWRDVPELTGSGMAFCWITTIDEVLEVALGRKLG